MPFLDKVVSALNTSWKGMITCFGEGQFFGISETIYDAKLSTDNETHVERYPGMITLDGEAVPISVDNQLAFVAYHKIESVLNTVDQTKSFGDGLSMVEVANMSLIVFAFRDVIKTTAYHLEAVFKDTTPSKITIPGLQTSSIKIGNSTFDKIALLTREFSKIDLSYPALFGFETKYTIRSVYQKGCFSKNFGCKTF